MNITKEKIDDLNAVVSVKIIEEDYRSKVEDQLKDYRRKAKMDGFRQGMVPIGIIRKLYYKPILAEEINKMVSENLMKYVREENIRILGEPLPHFNDEKIIDFDKDTEFEFSFDLGLVPDFQMNVGSKDKIPYYSIKVELAAIEEYIDNLTRRSGDFVKVDAVSGDEMIKGSLKQLADKNQFAENGISLEECSISIPVIGDEAIKKQFKKAKVGDRIVIDINKAFPNETDLQSLFRPTGAKIADINGLYQVEIKEILKFEKHAVNQELFDKVYGEGKINSEEEFREKISEELKLNYEMESNYRFSIDAKEYLIKKAKLSLPVDFLKRWLLATNEKLDSGKLDQEFNEYDEEFKWQLIKDQLLRENEISVSEEELHEFAIQQARSQFYQYGLYNVPDEHLDKLVHEQLNRPEDVRRLRDHKYEEKIISFIKDTVKLDKKEITREKFRKLFEK